MAPDIIQVVKQKARSARNLAVREWYKLCGKSEISWRYIANLGPWLRYKRNRPLLTDREAGMLNDLIRDGIVITSVKELFGETSLFDQLQARSLEAEIRLAREISAARGAIDSQKKVKSYLLTLLGPRPVLDPDDIFVRFALQPQILTVVNAYFGLLAKLRYYNVWHNFATMSEPKESQLWHRDPEDRYLIKLFVYLTDVDEGAGPLTYIPGTHARGHLRLKPPSTRRLEGRTWVLRCTDSQMSTVAPKSSWVTATGPRGTVVLADTTGYHKGGWARERDRIVYTCMFTSRASAYPEMFERAIPQPNCPDALARFALSN